MTRTRRALARKDATYHISPGNRAAGLVEQVDPGAFIHGRAGEGGSNGQLIRLGLLFIAFRNKIWTLLLISHTSKSRDERKWDYWID